METVFCSICRRTIYGGVEQLTNHLRRLHAMTLTNHSEFSCGQHGCAKTFVRLNSLKRRIRKNHSNERTDLLGNANRDIDSEHSIHFSVPEVHSDVGSEILQNVSQESRKSVLNIPASTSKLVGSLRACSSFTGAALSKVITGTEIFVAEIMNSLKNELLEFIVTEGVDQ